MVEVENLRGLLGPFPVGGKPNFLQQGPGFHQGLVKGFRPDFPAMGFNDQPAVR